MSLSLVPATAAPSSPEPGGIVSRRDGGGATLVVFDPKTQEHLTFSDAQVYEAEELDRNLRRSVFEIAFALKRILDERLYLALGFESREAYIEQRLPFNRAQAYTYKGIADTFGPLLLGEGSTESPVAGLEDLGVQKLDLLRQMDRERLTRLLREGVLDLGDGETVTLEEVKTDNVKKLADRVRRYRARVSELEERLKLTESERRVGGDLIEQAQAMMEEAERKMEAAEDLERLYGPSALSYEQQDRALAAAEAALAETRRHLIRCGVAEGSAETHHRRVAVLLRELDALRLDAHAAFGWVAEYVTADLPAFDLAAEIAKARAAGDDTPLWDRVPAPAETATVHPLTPAEA